MWRGWGLREGRARGVGEMGRRVVIVVEMGYERGFDVGRVGLRLRLRLRFW
jgi:hypothetical protein